MYVQLTARIKNRYDRSSKIHTTRVVWSVKETLAQDSVNLLLRTERPRMITGRCNKCTKIFTAYEGRKPSPTQFVNSIFGPAYICNCGNRGNIDIAEFAAKWGRDDD